MADKPIQETKPVPPAKPKKVRSMITEMRRRMRTSGFPTQLSAMNRPFSRFRDDDD